MEQLESNTFTNLIWSILKPYIRGKILYTPDTPATRRLVSIVNKTFEPVEDFRKLTQDYVNIYSKTIREVLLNGENQQVLKDIFQNNDSKSMFDAFLESPLGKMTISMTISMTIAVTSFMNIFITKTVTIP